MFAILIRFVLQICCRLAVGIGVVLGGGVVVVVAFVLVIEMNAAAIAAIGWVNLQPVCMRDKHPTCLMGGCLEQEFGRYSGEGPAGTRG